MEISIYRRIFLTAVGAITALPMAYAESPSATAVLRNSEAEVGQMVHMEIKVSGANNAEVPNDISVDGLEIHPTGTSRQFEMRNFTTTSSITYNYTILPLKGGTFRIPPQTVRAGGTTLRTEELVLHVAASAAGGSARGQNPAGSGGGQTADSSKIAFAELVVPKKTAYVGEVIPVVVRVGFFGRGQVTDLPEFKTQGFTMQKFQAPDHPQVETINGRRCEVWTFKTALSATRPGKFELGPVQTNAVVVVPRQRQRSNNNPNRPRSPFDIFDMDDPFSDPFFADPFGMMGQQQRRTIQSEPVALEVKSLPSGAPPGFSGAVGNFTMTVEANPKSVQVGDPITVTSTVTGRGNFDRIDGPVLEDERGWHKYPPTSKFKQDDDVGISGTKTFETVLSPNEKKQTIAPFVFSFFDPAKEKYVTLRSDAIPVRVEGTAIAAASPPPSAAAPLNPASPTPATAASPSTAATPKPQDILYQLTERPATAQSFVPLYERKTFWLAQIVPLLLLLAFLGAKLRQARLGNREARRTAALHHEAAELLRRLRRSDVPAQEYFSQASRAVQVKTALIKDVDPNVVDAETAARAFRLDETSHARLRELFQKKDEMRYSGASNGGVSNENKREVLDLIESLRA